MLEYYLFLDESGDFDEDLKRSWREECLVGGFLVKKESLLDEDEFKDLLIDEWINKLTEEFSQIRDDINKNGRCDQYGRPVNPRNAVMDKIRHATELDHSIKVKSIYALLPVIAGRGEFVIFENCAKSMVVNSTITYANILADGVIQLLTRLVLENPGDNIKLHILAGGRRDMTAESEERIYIADETVKNRMNERLKLLEIRSGSLLTSRVSYTFDYGDDKMNSYLIACDYICHFYFSRNLGIYRETVPKTAYSYAESLLQLYEPHNIFSLKGNAEREHVLQAISAESYGSLLFEAASGLINKAESGGFILNAISMLPEKSRKLHLQTFCNYCKEVIEVRRDLTLGEKVVEYGFCIHDYLAGRQKEDDRFLMEIILYGLAIKNHKGDISAMDNLFEKGKKNLRKLLRYSENLDLAFMFYNRYAVYLFDTFETEKAFDLLGYVIKQFEAYELLKDGLLSNTLTSMDSGELINNSDQLGRMLGTQSMLSAMLLKQGVIDYDTAIDISEKAIENLQTETDKQRQYQYRVPIEGTAGHYEKAFECLLRGCGAVKLSDLTGRRCSPFELYHISEYLRYTENLHTQDRDALLKYMKSREKEYLDRGTYPEFVITANMADAFANERQSAQSLANKYYEGAYGYIAEDTVLLKTLKLMIRSSQICYLEKVNRQLAEEKKTELRQLCGQILQQDLPESIHRVLKEFMDNGTDTLVGYSEFAQLRQY